MILAVMPPTLDTNTHLFEGDLAAIMDRLDAYVANGSLAADAVTVVASIRSTAETAG